MCIHAPWQHVFGLRFLLFLRINSYTHFLIFAPLAAVVAVDDVPKII